MKEIKITRQNGKEYTVIVDNEDYEELMKYKWYILKKTNTFYVQRHGKRYENGKYIREKILLHRQVLGATDSKIFIDHINHNGLDNRKENLRIANPTQNQHNQKPHKTYRGHSTSSKYKGVSWHKKLEKWQSQINIGNGKKKHLGYFHNEEDARDAYETKAKELQKEFRYIGEK